MDANKIQEKIFKTVHRFGKMKFETIIKELSKREFEMIVVISRHHDENPEQKGIFVSKLAEVLKVSPPAVSRMIGVLEEKGYIMRHTDKEDRRNTSVYLTDKGIREKEEAEKKMKRFMSKIAQRMGEEDVIQLLFLWNKIADIMEEELEGERHV